MYIYISIQLIHIYIYLNTHTHKHIQIHAHTHTTILLHMYIITQAYFDPMYYICSWFSVPSLLLPPQYGMVPLCMYVYMIIHVYMYICFICFMCYHVYVFYSNLSNSVSCGCNIYLDFSRIGGQLNSWNLSLVYPNFRARAQISWNIWGYSQDNLWVVKVATPSGARATHEKRQSPLEKNGPRRFDGNDLKTI